LSGLEHKHGFDAKKRYSRSLGKSAKWQFVVSESQLMVPLLLQLFLDVCMSVANSDD